MKNRGEENIDKTYNLKNKIIVFYKQKSQITLNSNMVIFAQNIFKKTLKFNLEVKYCYIFNSIKLQWVFKNPMTIVLFFKTIVIKLSVKKYHNISVQAI